MVQATERKERRNEKPVPHPEPSVKLVNTHLADCLLGVRTRRETHIAMEASTLIGANQRTILWRVRVAKLQMMPHSIRTTIESRTMWRAVLIMN